MKKKYFFLIFVVLAFLVSVIYYYKPSIVRVDIVYTNDLHGNIEVLPKIAYYVKKIKNKNLILIDSGDFIQGTPESDFFKGVSVVETFNFIGYDFVQIGNHEFDFGEENLISLSLNSRFNFLGSNIVDKNGQIKPYLKNYVIKTFDGLDIGVFGLITTKTKNIVLKENLKYIDFLDEVRIANDVVKKLYNNGVKIIFCVSHIGWVPEKEKIKYELQFSDLELAKQVSGINIIFGGHTHQKYKKFVGKTLIVQSGAYGKSFGHLTLWYNKRYGKIWWIKNKFVETKKIKSKHKEIEILVNNYIQETSNVYDVEIGKLEVMLDRNREQESSLGNLIADIIAQNVKCDFAITNSGGIRADLKKGNVTYRDIYMVMPFDNTITFAELSGKEVKEMFEYSVKSMYGILQVSKDIQISYDKEKNAYIKIKGNPISETKKYLVATNNFVSSGGDGYKWFLDKKVVDTKINLRDAIKKYFEKNSPISYKVEGRIIFDTIKQ